ncbi:hypothetical protein SAV14893_090550 [Streptomyces avermitilis]|uniref:Uncharacterized protein n=1 Tax=Streptomyces avermitilis TaxID=33903 RepID=A0A4D4N7V6_STRAX|nr:hypothetical protein SAVMC3_06040 [Streptomyces avermitilis]GDY69662.1 hypothetical protein SAV14893_090550 [Streptomyces avermitilis]GDY79916.1 hypothetical protein SAV31267_094010 [Streptomyces avermitilis]
MEAPTSCPASGLSSSQINGMERTPAAASTMTVTYRPCDMPPLPRPNASAASRLTVHSLWRGVVGWAPLFHDMGRGLEDKGSTHVGKFSEDADSVGHALDARPAHRPLD